jgi:hypothetical protein
VQTLCRITAVIVATFVGLASSHAQEFATPAAGTPHGESWITAATPVSTSLLFQTDEGGVPLPGDASVAPQNAAPAAGSSVTGSTPGTSTTPMFDSSPSDGLLMPQMMPQTVDTLYMSPDMMNPMVPQDGTWNAFSPVAPQDPFLTQPQPGYGAPMVSPYAPYAPYGTTPYGAAPGGIPPQGAFAYGANGPTPYRFGWQNRIDVSWLPGGDVEPNAGGATGEMDIFGVDYELAYGTPLSPGSVVNWTNQFSYRNWNGPDGGIGLPGDVYRFGIDLEWETPRSGPFSMSLGVTPSINTDFDGDTWGDGFQFDGRGILLWQLDQYWTLGLGAMYWDRVNDEVIPYAGLIYRDDYWEWQLMYPEAKVSLFLGQEPYWSKWAYVRAEYHVEAYAVNARVGAVSSDDEVEIQDYRILLGLKMDSGMSSWFIEGGWVLDRNVDFASATPGYGLDTGFIGQIGLRY